MNELCRVLSYYTDDISYDFIERESLYLDSDFIDFINNLDNGLYLYHNNRTMELAVISNDKLHVILCSDQESFDSCLQYTLETLPRNTNVVNLRKYRSFRDPRKTRHATD